MNKLFVASFLAVGLSISAFATDRVPVDAKGGVTEPAYAGASTCLIDNSTGTNAVLCHAGKGVILEVIASSVAASDYLTVRDSATANTSSARLFQMDSDDSPRVYPQYKNGLSANVSVAPPAATGRWTIIYRKLD